MKRLYGNALRKEAGVTKTFRGVASKQTQRAPPQVQKVVQEFQGTIERVFDDTSIAVEDFLRKCKPVCSQHLPRQANETPTHSWTQAYRLCGEYKGSAERARRTAPDHVRARLAC